jgi:hypothetical protein
MRIIDLNEQEYPDSEIYGWWITDAGTEIEVLEYQSHNKVAAKLLRCPVDEATQKALSIGWIWTISMTSLVILCSKMPNRSQLTTLTNLDRKYYFERYTLECQIDAPKMHLYKQADSLKEVINLARRFFNQLPQAKPPITEMRMSPKELSNANPSLFQLGFEAEMILETPQRWVDDLYEYVNISKIYDFDDLERAFSLDRYYMRKIRENYDNWRTTQADEYATENADYDEDDEEGSGALTFDELFDSKYEELTEHDFIESEGAVDIVDDVTTLPAGYDKNTKTIRCLKDPDMDEDDIKTAMFNKFYMTVVKEFNNKGYNIDVFSEYHQKEKKPQTLHF